MSRTSHSSQGPGYASHRSTASISSTASSSNRSERGGPRYAAPAVETAVTRLLVSIKQLLEALTLWSQRRMEEEGVSDVYVKLGNDFNAAVNAFTQFDIDMSELLSVPDDLRTVLEQCLAEEATHENLDLYLPSVRQIITNLLQGLRGKQSIYRRKVSDNRDRPRDSDRESQSGSSRPSSQRTSSHRDRAESRRLPTSGPSRRRDDISSTAARTEDGRDSVANYSTPIIEQTTGQSDARVPSAYTNGRSTPQPPPHVMDGDESSPSYNTRTLVPEPAPSVTSSAHLVDDAVKPSSPPPSTTMAAPASMKRYSLVDGPAPPTVEPPSPPIEINGTASPPPPDTPPPAVAKSLEALKSDNVLERRASKRFSTYLYKNVTGSAKSERTKPSSNPNRRSVAPGMSLTSNELDMVAEETDNEDHGPALKRSGSARSKLSRSNTPVKQHVPPLPSTPIRTPEPGQAPSTPAPAEPPQVKEPSRYTIFLQLGREVKKVTIDPGISFPSLRMLFLDKFAYNPGLENFPAIYIRDPSSGVQYELEDPDEVKDKCLLSLNIEALDQIKQHIDTQILTLANDIKDLKNTVMHQREMPPIMPMMNTMVSEPMAESTPARPTDRQFQQSARRLSTFVGNSTPSFLSQMQSIPNMPPGHLSMQMTGQSLQPQMTGGSVLSDYTSRVVTDLKTQFDEVQNLRRDIGVLRQIYTEFMKSTKESLGKLRTQTQSVKQLADTNVGGARAYIATGKQKLDTRSQNVLTEVERLQDLIEDMKDDVVKRQVTPNGMAFKTLKKDLDAVASELNSLSEHIATVRPMWKKTWEEELQNIVDEQKLLTHQEELLSDLKEDHKAMMEIYGHVEKVITLRKPSNNSLGKRRQFRPPPKDEGHEGLSTVMLEIRGATVDPKKRMEAIEASQKNRQKNLQVKNDELTQELTEFVSQKKLRMTGGADEVERVRQKRSEMTLRAMFAGESGVPAGPFGVIEE
ncbi:actin interacting protein 3-domain-containing protein [Panaeolus papilionaceus]|nr:actin interacting protein 3-domain-containing protein [Panaeolus papilionaceus]